MLRKISTLDMNIQKLRMEADSMDNETLVSHRLRKEMYDLMAQKDRLSGSIKKSSGDSVKSVNLMDFRNTMQPGVALLEVFVGDSAVFMMKISEDGESLVKIDRVKIKVSILLFRHFFRY
jgi:hypothetical protein